MTISRAELSALVREDSVHKRVYTDPEIFRLEMQRIYGQAWVYVGHESQVKRIAHARLLLGSYPGTCPRDVSGWRPGRRQAERSQGRK